MIGHEIEGQIAYVLKNEGLIYELVTSSTEILYLMEEFNIGLKLTPKGASNINRIFEVIGKYLHMLRSQNNFKQIFEELQRKQRINFDFQNQMDDSNNAQNISMGALVYPIQYSLVQHNLFYEYKEDVIKNYLKHLNSKSLIVFFSHKGIENLDLNEKYYSTPYSVETLSDEFI